MENLEIYGNIKEKKYDLIKESPKITGYASIDKPWLKFHSEKALELYKKLSKHFMTMYDESGNIGKRYRRSDVIGVPFAVTIDDETLNNQTVTVRDRDTMEQITLKVEELVDYINKKMEF